MASSGINKVILVGHLGADPEVKMMSSGNSVANLSIATSDSWRDRTTGEMREKTEWHRVAIFGKLAEIAGQYLSKGSQVYIEGQLQTRKWQDQNGQDRYTTEIVVQGYNGVMQMLGGRGQNSGAQQGGYANNNQQNQGQQGQWQNQGQQNQGQWQNQANNQAGQFNQQPAGQGFQQPTQQSAQQPMQQVATDAGFDDDIPF